MHLHLQCVLRLSSTVCKAKTTISQTVRIKASQCSLNVHLLNSSLAVVFWRCFLKEPKQRNKKYSLNPNPENIFSAKLDLNLPPTISLFSTNKQIKSASIEKSFLSLWQWRFVCYFPEKVPLVIIYCRKAQLGFGIYCQVRWVTKQMCVHVRKQGALYIGSTTGWTTPTQLEQHHLALQCWHGMASFMDILWQFQIKLKYHITWVAIIFLFYS